MVWTGWWIGWGIGWGVLHVLFVFVVVISDFVIDNIGIK